LKLFNCNICPRLWLPIY